MTRRLLHPLLGKVLRDVAAHEGKGTTAREIGLNVNAREAAVRRAVHKLADLGLVDPRVNTLGITFAHITRQGRELVAEMSRERIALVEHEAILAAADPADIETCPSCNGERVYCNVCVGTRLVTVEQVR